MKNFLLLSTLALVFCTPSFSQENPSSKKNELSLDLLTFTRKNVVPGLIYKRKGESGAFRLKLNSAFDFNEISNTSTPADTSFSRVQTTDEVGGFEGQFFIGYEWNKHIQSKWTIFYGADLVLDISKQTNTKKEVYRRNNGTVGQIVTNENEVSATKFGFAPFIGCNYYFNESISIGVESYVLALFGTEDVTSTITNQSSTGTTTLVDSNGPSTIQLDLSPKTLLTIGYRF